jgi:hypothetical protein
MWGVGGGEGIPSSMVYLVQNSKIYARNFDAASAPARKMMRLRPKN